MAPREGGSIPRFVLIERRMARFLREPPSVRYAASTIVVVTAVIVVASGVLMHVLDREEYPNVWLGIWWAIQTVTTVGYGDVTPKDVAGRIVAAFVMLEAVALVAVVTAGVTSTFVRRAEREREALESEGVAIERERLQARFDTVDARLERIETELRKLTTVEGSDG